jgi:hypothetical protein
MGLRRGIRQEPKLAGVEGRRGEADPVSAQLIATKNVNFDLHPLPRRQ